MRYGVLKVPWKFIAGLFLGWVSATRSRPVVTSAAPGTAFVRMPRARGKFVGSGQNASRKVAMTVDDVPVVKGEDLDARENSSTHKKGN